MKKILIILFLSIFLISCNRNKLPHYKLESVDLVESKRSFDGRNLRMEDIYIYNITVSDTAGIYEFKLRLKNQIPNANLRIGDSIVLSENFIRKLK